MRTSGHMSRNGFALSKKQGFPKGILPRFFYQPLSFVANIPFLHQWGKWRKNDHWDLDAFITLPRLEFG
ncbi:hypothetical protein [Rhodonellum sp.]|uniref:hypothetical protein n=1 Tax=Rhodonellum sp. TaxID=2231180 RepID=UPI00271B1646|nr:hypothetical protein [Rhodonellum sp.]MDO9551058.1 hypothetical protein [Rhodonellum sp.]